MTHAAGTLVGVVIGALEVEVLDTTELLDAEDVTLDLIVDEALEVEEDFVEDVLVVEDAFVEEVFLVDVVVVAILRLRMD